MRWKRRQPRDDDARRGYRQGFRFGIELVTGCVSVGILVGIAGAPHGQKFGWEIAVLASTAVATVLLAGYTALLGRATLSVARTTATLASVTSQDATATQQLVKIAQEDQRRAIEPVIVVVSRNAVPRMVPEQSVTNAKWQITLRNVGRGAALDLQGFTYTLTREGEIKDEKPAFTLSAVAALEEATVTITTANPDPLIGGTCTDSSERGERLTFGYHGIKRRRDAPAEPT